MVVTRATEQAGTLRSLLEGHGATVLEVPLLSIVDPADGSEALRTELSDPDRFAWIVVTSPNGAAAVRRFLGDRVTLARFAVVGRGTEEALGRPADLVPTRQVAEGLLDAFPPGPGRVLVAQGDQARAVLADGLQAAGWEVHRVVAYRNVPADVPTDLREAVALADIVTFASGSAVRAYAAAIGTPPANVRTVSIGPVTTDAARLVGVRIDTTATEHSLAGLVDAVVEGVTPHDPADD